MTRRARALHLLLLTAILAVAAALRVDGMDWDQGAMFHPDERAILMKVSELAIPWPPNVAQLFDPTTSPLNPRWFPYGSFPLYLLKVTGLLAGHLNPALDLLPDLRLVGRTLAVAFDVGTVLLTYLTGTRLYRREAGLVAAAFVALSVLHIQLSHFYTVDVIVTCMVMVVLYGAARTVTSGHSAVSTLLMGVGLGLGLATKVSIAPLALAIGIAQLLPLFPTKEATARVGGKRAVPAGGASFAPAIGHLLATAVLAAVIFTVAEPFALLDNATFLRDVTEQNNMVTRALDYPYTRQYVDTTPYLYQLQQLGIWGLGLPLGLAYLVGALAAVRRVLMNGSRAELLLLAWMVPYFVITGAFPVKFLRYMLPILPALAVLAARLLDPAVAEATRRNVRSYLRSAITLVVLTVSAWYAVAYLNIYRGPHPAQEASEWIKTNIPAGALLLKEHWEEGLPDLPQYPTDELPLYDDDNAAKVARLSEELAKGQAVLFYSNRLYGTIPRLPQRYPISSTYYRRLFNGELGYELAYVATAYPSLFGVTLADDTFARPGLPPPGDAAVPQPSPITLNFGYADESFTVYDHPKVMVFRKVRQLTAPQIAALLVDGAGVPSSATPATAPAARGLLLSDEDRAVQEAGGTWRDLFDPESLANRSPSLVWYLVVQLLGLLALPLTLLLCRGLPDGGYAFAKLLGLLGMAWLAWLAAALKLGTFTPGTILAGCALIGAASAWAVWRRRATLRARLASAAGVIAVEEALFGVAFLAFYGIRLLNPDLWHPYRGGEKPMDFAYLLAVIKSTTMPPYDPWFAGGYLNYYYYGQVIVGALIKLTGILPEVAYNLAVPLFYALLASGAFSVVYNLSESARRALGMDLNLSLDYGRPADPTVSYEVTEEAKVTPRALSPRGPVLAGLAGAAAVALLGNLDGPTQVLDGLWNASGIAVTSPVPGVAGITAAAIGLMHVIQGLGSMPAFDFWRSSRMMPPTISITEFPFFTFLFADLHAHLLALPITVLALALAINHALGSRGRSAASECGSLLVLGWVLGTLRWTNSWDFPTWFLFAGGAILVGEAQRSGRLRWPETIIAGAKLLAIYGASALTFLPFARTFEQFYAGVVPSPETTPVHQYLLINGIFLFPIAGLVALEALAAWRGEAAWRWATLYTTFWYEGTRIARLRRRLAYPAAHSGAGLVAVALLSAVLVAAGVLAIGSELAALLALALAPVLALIGLELRRLTAGGAELTLVLGLVALALAIAVGVEFITLQGDIQRMNTVFKFYLQTWVLLATAAAFGGWWIATGGWQRARPRVPAASVRRLANAVQPLATPFAAVATLLAVGGLVYPLLATPARIADRFQPLLPTPDGLAYMQGAVYNDEHGPLTLAYDAEAIRWLRESVDGSPTIIEGITPIYRWGGRVSINTGLPTVLGWDWHQRQQRWGYQQMVDERIDGVNRLYTDPSRQAALDVIRTYGVQYVYVGELERRYYPAAGLAKFQQMVGDTLEIAFSTQQVTIYRVIPGRV
jgi:YYY domain-containing protein